ncbi:MAG: TerC family protein [Phycisphaerales bacterium]|nr:TerC family protein [Phycisphaerales bacterium]
MMDISAVADTASGSLPLLSWENATALVALTGLEIVLGIDNIVFIAILSSRLPPAKQPAARRTGLIAAMLMRILLLLSLGYVTRLTEPIITGSTMGHTIALSWRDIILIVGGLVLLIKSTREIHHAVEGQHDAEAGRSHLTFASVIAQIMIMDVVFSIDSVITAVGMSNSLTVMVAAVMISVAVMVAFAERISNFVHRHPSIKMLALSFLILIGVMLLAEGFGQHVPKGYVYFAMAFSLGVEMLNTRARSKLADD